MKRWVKLFNYKLRTLVRVLKSFGIVGVISLMFNKISILFKGRTRGTPSQSGFLAFDFLEPEILLKKLFDKSAVLSPSLVLDYQKYNQDFESRLKTERKSFFGSVYDLGPKTRYLVFSIIRLMKPGVVVETGVAAGASSNTFLAALTLNEMGRLESIDITKKVGELVDPAYEQRWTVHILGKIWKKYSFERIIKSLGDCEIFIHDSDHSPQWQIFEFRVACESMRSTNLLVFDDVTPELIDFVKTHHPNFEIYFIREDRKYSAVFLRR
jgi:hypothetical protein